MNQSYVPSPPTYGSSSQSGDDTGQRRRIPLHDGDVVGQRFVELRRLPVPGFLLALRTWVEKRERERGVKEKLIFKEGRGSWEGRKGRRVGKYRRRECGRVILDWIKIGLGSILRNRDLRAFWLNSHGNSSILVINRNT